MVNRYFGYNLTAAMLFLTAQGSAEVYNVSDGDVAAFAAAVSSANLNPGVDSIALQANGTYTFDGTSLFSAASADNALPEVTEALIVEGNGSLIERSSLAPFRFFTVSSGSSLTVRNATIKNGFINNTYGGAIHSTGDLVLESCTFEDNLVDNSSISLTASGGAIWLITGGLTISDCSFIGNSTIQADGNAEGGAINIYNGTALSMERCAFKNNSCYTTKPSSASKFARGGAIRIASCTSFTIRDSLFEGNSVSGLDSLPGSGYLYAESGGLHSFATDGLVERCSFIGNSTNFTPSAIYHYTSANAATMEIRDTTVSGNSTSLEAGEAILMFGSNTSAILRNVTAINNTPLDAQLNASVNLVIANSIIEGLTVTSSGTSTIENNLIHKLSGTSSLVTYSPGGTNESFNTLGIESLEEVINLTAYELGTNGLPLHPLINGSLAINAGDNTLTFSSLDQQGTGFPRIVDTTVDMGAHEYAPLPIMAAFAQLNQAETFRDVVACQVTFDVPPYESLTAEDLQLSGDLAANSTALVRQNGVQDYTIFLIPNDPLADGTIGFEIGPNVLSLTKDLLTGITMAPLFTMRNVPADTDDDGAVSATELNAAVLAFRGITP